MGILTSLRQDILRSQESESVIESMTSSAVDESIKSTFIDGLDVDAETMDISDPEINDIIDMIPEAGAKSEEEVKEEIDSVIESMIPETTI